MKIMFSFFPMFFCLFLCYSQNDYPEPVKTKTRLFYIQHSNNQNTYVYDANIKEEVIDSVQPINEYRIVYTENGTKKPLSIIQREMAYGMILIESQHNLFRLRLAATEKIYFYLNYDERKKAKIYVFVNNHKMYLDKMFVQIKDGVFGINVKVEYVLFYGKDCNSNKLVTEKVIIK